MKEIYEHFYQRQNDIWISKANSKFEFISTITQSLICAEDADILSPQMIDCFKQFGFLSFNAQRDPNINNQYLNKYLSICCPSTPNMMPLRQWWEEETDRKKIYDFWK